MMQARWIARRVEQWLTEIPAGRVHSRFHSVLNLAWGPHLITLALPEAGRLPGGILLEPATVRRAPAAHRGDLATPGITWPGAQGDPVAYDRAAQLLRFPNGQVYLGAARREGADPAPLTRIEPERLAQNLSILVRLARLSGKGSLVPLLNERGFPSDPELRRLAGALAMGDQSALIATARPMLGRGEGLTPAWDDLLLGLLAALWCAGPALPHQTRQAGQALAQVLAQEATRRTTAISANYLRLAADGGWSERLLDATLALFTATGPALVAPIQRLFAFGHSSGHDTAVGLALGGATILAIRVGGNSL
jgi:hypothetical protein